MSFSVCVRLPSPPISCLSVCMCVSLYRCVCVSLSATSANYWKRCSRRKPLFSMIWLVWLLHFVHFVSIQYNTSASIGLFPSSVWVSETPGSFPWHSPDVKHRRLCRSLLWIYICPSVNNASISVCLPYIRSLAHSLSLTHCLLD